MAITAQIDSLVWLYDFRFQSTNQAGGDGVFRMPTIVPTRLIAQNKSMSDTSESGKFLQQYNDSVSIYNFNLDLYHLFLSRFHCERFWENIHAAW